MGSQPNHLVLLVWRFSNYSDLSGRGGLIASGRWHTHGQSIVYTADTPRTAFAEAVKRVSGADFIVPNGLQLLEIHVPNSVSRSSIDRLSLPVCWDQSGPRGWSLCQPIGDAWLVSGTTALLKVPSAALPGADNYLINPAHRDSDRITVKTIYDATNAVLKLD